MECRHYVRLGRYAAEISDDQLSPLLLRAPDAAGGYFTIVPPRFVQLAH